LVAEFVLAGCCYVCAGEVVALVQQGLAADMSERVGETVA